MIRFFRADTMTKQHILNEIKRTAEANSGLPLGVKAFLRETGIKVSDWHGKHWARWNDAVEEAGFVPNKPNTAFSDDFIIEKLISLIRELGRYPSRGDLKLKVRSDQSFPSPNVFGRLGAKKQLIQKVVQYCNEHPGFEDIPPLCQVVNSSASSDEDIEPSEEFGFVYLLKSGRYYKIGRSNSAGRRERELAIQLPEKAVNVHVIQTDDPIGIEAYWHRRFEAKRKNGEWFELGQLDVKAFKRRKFM